MLLVDGKFVFVITARLTSPFHFVFQVLEADTTDRAGTMPRDSVGHERFMSYMEIKCRRDEHQDRLIADMLKKQLEAHQEGRKEEEMTIADMVNKLQEVQEKRRKGEHQQIMAMFNHRRGHLSPQAQQDYDHGIES